MLRDQLTLWKNWKIYVCAQKLGLGDPCFHLCVKVTLTTQQYLWLSSTITMPGPFHLFFDKWKQPRFSCALLPMVLGKGWWYVWENLFCLFPYMDISWWLHLVPQERSTFSLSRYLNTMLILEVWVPQVSCAVIQSFCNWTLPLHFVASGVTGCFCFNVQLILLFCSTRECTFPNL